MPACLLSGCRRDDKDTMVGVAGGSGKEVTGTVGYGGQPCAG